MKSLSLEGAIVGFLVLFGAVLFLAIQVEDQQKTIEQLEATIEMQDAAFRGLRLRVTELEEAAK